MIKWHFHKLKLREETLRREKFKTCLKFKSDFALLHFSYWLERSVSRLHRSGVARCRDRWRLFATSGLNGNHFLPPNYIFFVYHLDILKFSLLSNYLLTYNFDSIATIHSSVRPPCRILTNSINQSRNSSKTFIILKIRNIFPNRK